jgi:hypothetical protein
MKLQSEGLFRLPFGAADMRNPQVLQLLYKVQSIISLAAY